MQGTASRCLCAVENDVSFCPHGRPPGHLNMHIGLIVGIGPAATDYYYR